MRRERGEGEVRRGRTERGESDKKGVMVKEESEREEPGRAGGRKE